MQKPIVDPRAPRDGSPEVTPEIQSMIDEAVKAATEPLRATLEQVRQNRDSILREKRELEGRAVEDAEARQADQPKPIDYAITRDEARDPNAYRRAKQRAHEAGVELLILDTAKIKRQGEPRQVHLTDTHYHVFGPSIAGDTNAYREHKAEAEKRGLRFHVASSPDQMPDAAFEGGEA